MELGIHNNLEVSNFAQSVEVELCLVYLSNHPLQVEVVVLEHEFDRY